MSKHTPGPWKISVDGNVVSEQAGVVEKIAVSVLCGKARKEANAQLIAAAPAMLEALVKAIDLINGLAVSGCPGYLNEQEDKDRKFIEAAIRAAKGGAI